MYWPPSPAGASSSCCAQYRDAAGQRHFFTPWEAARATGPELKKQNETPFILWVLLSFLFLPHQAAVFVSLPDGHADFHESPKQDSWSFPADVWPGRGLYLQPCRLDAVPPGTETSPCVRTQWKHEVFCAFRGVYPELYKRPGGEKKCLQIMQFVNIFLLSI